MSFRIQKVNKLIKQQISKILSRDLNLKSGIFLTVSKVDTTKDLRYTRIFVSVFPESEEGYIVETLKKEIYSIQGKLNKAVHIKPLPKIEFFLDKTEAEASEIERLLNEIEKENK